MERESKRVIKGKPYMIFWKDHASHDSGSAWNTEGSTLDITAPVAISLGWVVKQDKIVVALAQTIDKKSGIKGEVGNIWLILKSAIEKVVPLEASGEKRKGFRKPNEVEVAKEASLD